MKPETFPGLEYRRVEAGPLAEAARGLEYRVFTEVGYEGPGPYMSEFEKYRCLFYVALEGDKVVGSVRKALPTNGRLPTLDMATIDRDHPLAVRVLRNIDACEDIAASAVAKGYRTRCTFACILNLYRLAWQDAVRGRVRLWTSVIDAVLLPHFRGLFHFNFREIGPAQDFLGATCLPCALDLDSAAGYMEGKDPDLIAWFREGLSDEPAISERV